MALLPDCMMPDGAEPCKGYTQLYERINKIEAMRRALRTLVREGTDGRWYVSQHGDADVTSIVGDLLKGA